MTTKVTLNESVTTPSQEAVAKSLRAVQVVDSTGRKITLKKPGVLAQFRLVEALGAVAENRVYMAMVLPLIYVCDIDGEPVTTVLRKSEVDALIQRLDEYGIESVMKAIQDNFTPPDPEADKDSLKK